MPGGEGPPPRPTPPTQEGRDDRHAPAAVRPRSRRARCRARDQRARCLRRTFHPRAVTPRAGPPARVADQRLRVLHRHAHEGCAQARGDRAAPVRADRLARDAVLHGARACGARVDGGADADRGVACAGRRLRGGAQALRRGGARRADGGGDRDQRVEPRGDQHAHGSRDVRAVGRTMGARDLLTLFALAALWGASYLFIRIGVPALGPLPLAAGRTALAALVLWVGLRALGRRPVLRPHARGLLVLGATNAALPFFLIGAAELHLTASLAAILTATTPLWAVIFSVLWLGERITLRRSAGLLL